MFVSSSPALHFYMGTQTCLHEHRSRSGFPCIGKPYFPPTRHGASRNESKGSLKRCRYGMALLCILEIEFLLYTMISAHALRDGLDLRDDLWSMGTKYRSIAGIHVARGRKTLRISLCTYENVEPTTYTRVQHYIIAIVAAAN